MNFNILETLYIATIVIDKDSGDILYSYGKAPFENLTVKNLDALDTFLHQNYSTQYAPIFDKLTVGEKHYWIIRKSNNNNIYYFIQECKQWDQLIEDTKKGTHLDGLTKCYTKIELEAFITNYLSTFLRYKDNSFSLLMYDIDWFKKVNDVHGHLTGDYVLTQLSALVKTLLRDSDICGRFGGEEFIAILPQTKVAGALKLANKINQAVQDYDFSFQDTKIDITISVGVTSVGNDDSLLSLIDRCDTALYDAKKNGRNRVEYR